MRVALYQARVRVVLLLALLAGCQKPRDALTSCDDKMGGIWRAPDGRRYHFLDSSDRVEGYPLWDSSRLPDGTKPMLAGDPSAPPPPVWHSPSRLLLFRKDGALAGKGHLRRTEAGKRPCEVKWPVSVDGCSGAQAVLHERVVVGIEPGCVTTLSADDSLVPLVRE
jgi:hypothetical protein